MTMMTSLFARAGALISAAKNPWGDRKTDGDGEGDKGAGPTNPWAQPPGGKRNRGTRTTSVFDQLSDKMRDGFGGGSGGGSGDGGGSGFGGLGWPVVRLFLVVLIALWILFTSVWRIAPQEQGVVTTLGAYSRTLDPGIGMTLPWPFERVTKIKATERRSLKVPTEGGTNFVLTGDQNILDLDYVVQWSVSAPELFLFELAEPESTIKDVADSAMRAAIANYTFSGASGAERGKIEADAAERMRKILQAYRTGIRIESVSIKAADPPKEVNEAFKEVAVAEQEAQAALNDANGYKQQVVQRALGGAAAFDAIYEQYKLAPGVTRSRLYYETMEAVLSKVDKVIVEAPGISSYLPLPEMRRRLAEPPASAPTPAPPPPAAGEETSARKLIVTQGGDK